MLTSSVSAPEPAVFTVPSTCVSSMRTRPAVASRVIAPFVASLSEPNARTRWPTDTAAFVSELFISPSFVTLVLSPTTRVVSLRMNDTLPVRLTRVTPRTVS